MPNVGAAIFSSGGRQLEVDTSSQSLRQRFADERAAQRNRLAALSKERSVPVLPISTHLDVATQLRELIGKHAARRTASLLAAIAMNGPASLANLRDIALPPLPSFWPPAAGVTIVAACVLAFFAIQTANVVRRARMKSVEGVAATEIDRICRQASGEAEVVAAMSAVLKRAALAAYPREAVASLTGAEWAAFLEERSGTSSGSDALKEFLGRVQISALLLQPGDLRGLAEQA